MFFSFNFQQNQIYFNKFYRNIVGGLFVFAISDFIGMSGNSNARRAVVQRPSRIAFYTTSVKHAQSTGSSLLTRQQSASRLKQLFFVVEICRIRRLISICESCATSLKHAAVISNAYFLQSSRCLRVLPSARSISSKLKKFRGSCLTPPPSHNSKTKIFWSTRFMNI